VDGYYPFALPGGDFNRLDGFLVHLHLPSHKPARA
jgi:hypothetical protein